MPAHCLYYHHSHSLTLSLHATNLPISQILLCMDTINIQHKAAQGSHRHRHSCRTTPMHTDTSHTPGLCIGPLSRLASALTLDRRTSLCSHGHPDKHKHILPSTDSFPPTRQISQTQWLFFWLFCSSIFSFYQLAFYAGIVC